jgi:hypothetical protein
LNNGHIGARSGLQVHPLGREHLRSEQHQTDAGADQEWGFGEFILYEVTSVAKVFTVVKNRNGNPTVHGTPPDTLDGLSTIRLERLARALAAVVKLWPRRAGPRQGQQAHCRARAFSKGSSLARWLD